MEEDYLPNLNEELGAVTQLMAGPKRDESLQPGLLTGAELATRSNQLPRSANKSERSTNARLKLPA